LLTSERRTEKLAVGNPPDRGVHSRCRDGSSGSLSVYKELKRPSNVVSGAPTTRPATAPTSGSPNEDTKPASHLGSGPQSESVKATISPFAERIPVLRAADALLFGSTRIFTPRSVRSAKERMRVGPSSVEPLSTRRISRGAGASRSRASKRKGRVRAAFRTGMTTETPLANRPRSDKAPRAGWVHP